MIKVGVSMIGLNIKELIEKVDLYCWDLDGTLGVYAFGENGINSCSDGCYLEYLEKYNPYEKVKPNVILKKFIETYTNKDINYVITVAQSEKEKEYKKRFILSHYKESISENHIIFVESWRRKYEAMQKIESERGLNRLVLIDDTIKTLSMVQDRTEYYTVHVSSFMGYAELLG